MLTVIACLAGVLCLLVLDEWLAKNKILKSEYRRKFVHVTVGTFVAFWPWLISWRAIQIIGLLMVVIVALNRQRQIFKFNRNLERETYGDFFFAVAILLCALLTDTKIFFTLAILHLALADGLASIIGRRFGAPWKYKVYRQTKTVVGSMTFWIASLGILGAGILFAHNQINFTNYVALLVALPPVLTIIENASPLGLDNILVPVVVLAGLNIAQATF